MREMELTDAELARLEELAGEATPRPWIMAKDCDESDHMEVTDEKGVVCCTDLYGFEYPEQWNNGRYIAAACNAVPSLVAEVRRLREENEQMQHGMTAAYMFGKADGGLPPSFYAAEELRKKVGALEADKRLLEYAMRRIQEIHDYALSTAPKQAIGESLSVLISDLQNRRIRGGSNVEIFK